MRARRSVQSESGAIVPKGSQSRFVSVIVAIATGGVALGTAALIITLAILAGFEDTLTNNLVGFTSHAEISGYGNRPLPDYESASRWLLKRVPEITRLTPYVQQEVVLRAPHGVAGLLIKGLPLSDTALIARKRIIAGTDFQVASLDSLPPILLSKSTAQELHTSVGKSIAAIRFNEHLRTREDILSNFMKFRVIGIFQTGMAEYDDALAYTTLDAAQRFSSYSSTQVNGYEVMTTSLDSARSLTAKLNKTVHYPYYAQSVYDIHRPIFAWIELQKEPIPIILGLIIIVATFNVISTLLLIVIEKTHSIGVLKALGARDGGIAKIFLTEGTAIAIMGVVVGDLFGFLVCTLEAHFHFFKLRSEIYFMSSVPVSIEWQHYAIVSGIALILALSATLIPARIASRMRPLSALKFG